MATFPLGMIALIIEAITNKIILFWKNGV